MKIKRLLILLCCVSGAVGCASKSKQNNSVINLDISRQTIDQITPDVTVPAAATQPASQASPDALQLYAESRDALLENRKKDAIDKLNAAIELDSNSSVLYRDLGYAWFGTDNLRSLAAFRRAAEIDPNHVEIHAQIGRLLAIQGKLDEAIIELRIARITPGYQSSPLDAALVDLLLGKLLSERGYLTASADSFERLLPVIERKSMEMRRWVELLDLANNPSKLRLTLADISARIGRYERALELFEIVKSDQPAIAPAVELRIIQTRMKMGDVDQATQQMIEIVKTFGANRSSIQSYIDLFAEVGGDSAALHSLRKNITKNQKDLTAIRVLETRLLRRLKQYDHALEVIDQPDLKASFPSVRELVMAYRDAGKNEQLILRLLELMINQPANWSAIWRGWEIITQNVQPVPLTTIALQHIPIPSEYEAGRSLVAARIALAEHQKIISQQLLSKAMSLDEPLVRKWTSEQVMQFVPDVDLSSPIDVTRFAEEFSNDPRYLQMSVEYLVKNGATLQITTALQTVVGQNPRNIVALTQLVGLLLISERKTEAIKAVEDSSAAVASSPELYQLAMLAGQLEQKDLNERLLRKSVTINPSHAPSANDLGYQLVDSGREIDFAEGLLWKAVSQEPGNGAYLDSLGWMLYKRGQFNQAALYLEQAISNSDPIDPVVLDHAGDTYHRLNITDKSHDFWQKAIEQIKKSPDESDPQLRLQIEQKLRQLASGESVNLAPTLEEHRNQLDQK